MKETSFKRFIIVWLGQFASLLGSGLSSFGLSVWIFYITGAATPFAISFLCSILPSVIFSPLAGSFADRMKRKTIIMLTDSLDAFLKIVMAILLFADMMQLWIVYVIMFLSSTLSTFQGPAFNASIPMMVGEKNVGRANGLLQLSQAAQNLATPVLAGILYPLIALKGLLIIDFITFGIGIATVAVTHIPQEELGDGEKKVGLNIVGKDFVESFRYLKRQKNLMSYIIVFAFLNFIANICMILIGPMVLSNYDTAIYGTVQTIYGSAMVVGGFLASVIPERKNRPAHMFAGLVLSGIGLAVVGISPKWMVIAAGMFVFYLMVPYTNSLFQTIIQTSIDKKYSEESVLW